MAPVRLVVAQVRGLHGLNGAVRVEVLTDRPEARFAAGRVLHVEGDPRPLTISGAEPVDFEWSGCRVAPTVCYDLRFPELFRRAVARSGRAVELLAVIANWPVARIEHWSALLRARAIENQAYVAGCNRIGTDPALTYNGHSQIIDPSGKVVADAGGKGTVIRAELDLANLREYRRKLPFLADMRE